MSQTIDMQTPRYYPGQVGLLTKLAKQGMEGWPISGDALRTAAHKTLIGITDWAAVERDKP